MKNGIGEDGVIAVMQEMAEGIERYEPTPIIVSSYGVIPTIARALLKAGMCISIGDAKRTIKSKKITFYDSKNALGRQVINNEVVTGKFFLEYEGRLTYFIFEEDPRIQEGG